MKVGRIPALTWNRIRANEADVEDDISLNTSVDTQFRTLPEGVTSRALSKEETVLWLCEHAPQEPAEAVMAGKEPIYHPQRFGTGLGAEYDIWAQESGAPVILLEAAPGTKAAKPVLWELSCPDGSRSVQSQILHVGAGASITVLEVYRSGRYAEGLSGISTKIVLEEGAQLTLVKAQMLGTGFLHFDDTGAALFKDARLHMIQIELGAQKAYVGTQPELIGDRSRFETGVSWLGQGSSVLDINYNAVQRGRKTETVMNFDGVLADQSAKTFRGTIDFRRGSSGSSGNEKENVLLLSDEAVNKTLPVILCEEDDMEGSHGATIGRLGEDVLFYLASRGIDEKEAERMMVRARFGAACRNIPDESLREELMEMVEEAVQE